MYNIFITLIVCVFCGTQATKIPDRLLNNGMKIPIVGLGAMDITEQAVRDAIDLGYRHIDTSHNYHTSDKKNWSEIIIGKVLNDVFKTGKIRRQDMFIVSKLEADYHQRQRVVVGIKETLTNLGLDYLDMYLVHHPNSSAPVNISITETWQGMIDVLQANLTRSIGVSNFNEQQIDEISKLGVIPVTNQVLCNPYVVQKPLLAYSDKHYTTLTAYSPIGGSRYPNLLKDPKLVEIAGKHKITAAQVALKFQVQRDVIVIPKANTLKYLKENLDLFSFSLTDQEIKDIEALNKRN
ncbi:aldose reductase-related protein 2-like [Oppia nitens]|uniref:aldose reductase-related protein 2-like n=1 Tax=Oppia nitens TaxID=1686743 RepID=UPI0023DB335A|nr:aldose reductase-related protein 2-like [Oppia nitens]